jgi:hypothetical protein
MVKVVFSENLCNGNLGGMKPLRNTYLVSTTSDHPVTFLSIIYRVLIPRLRRGSVVSFSPAVISPAFSKVNVMVLETGRKRRFPVTLSLLSPDGPDFAVISHWGDKIFFCKEQ